MPLAGSVGHVARGAALACPRTAPSLAVLPIGSRLARTSPPCSRGAASPLPGAVAGAVSGALHAAVWTNG